ncbi:hypothetical protein [Amycolatopsis sp. NPDC051061]|uniref:hypothetical protein n=1 Tax=Amycolatopsis sp. NPDC051061 TaxID=3155042 RepID=UPI0034221794
MRKSSLVRRGGLLAAVVASVVLAGAAPAWASPGDGSAYGVKVDVKLLGRPAVKAGPLAAAATAGPASSSLAKVDLPASSPPARSPPRPSATRIPGR